MQILEDKDYQSCMFGFGAILSQVLNHNPFSRRVDCNIEANKGQMVFLILLHVKNLE
jgi:hypothetical protein